MLRPKKAKDFISEVAKSVSLPQDVVEDVVNYYWEEVRKSLSSLSHQRIHLTNLGDFVIKYWKLDDKIERLEKWEENNKLKGIQEVTARFKTAENLFNLKSLKTIIEEENQRKEFIKLHKHESKRKHNKNMESKGADNRGDNK